MSWGHAVCKDLVRWESKGIGIHYKEDTKEFLFSGSAVYDVNNTSGFGTAENPPVVAIFTSFYSEPTTHPDGTKVEQGTQSQSIANSTDKGNTWQFYDKNPVIRSPPEWYATEFREFRDPKVFWYAPHNKWVMVTMLAQKKKALFWTSQNLKDWTVMSEFSSRFTPDGVWECPDIFKLNISGQNESKWVLLVSANPGGVAKGFGMHYYIGDFDGYRFTEETDEKYHHIKWLDYGSDFYAAISWNNVDTGRYLVAWIDNWEYAYATHDEYKGAIGFVRELSLITVDGTITVSQKPVGTLANYIKEKKQYSLEDVRTGVEILMNKAYELIIELSDIGESGFIFVLQDDKNNVEAEIKYGDEGKTLSIRKKNRDPKVPEKYVMHYAPYKKNILENRETLRIFIDSNTLALFSTRGDVAFTELLISYAEKRKFYLKEGGKINVNLTRQLLEF
nr:putative GH32 family protein [Eupelmus annulatus]